MDYGPETGNLCVRFDVSAMNPPILGVMQDNADEGHVLSEGSDGVMKTGRMWLVDKNDNVVVFGEMGVNNSTSTKHKFTNIKRGEYKLYILLNSTELDGFTEGKTIDDSFKKKCLATIASGASPEYTVESGVPCSIVKDVAIAAGNNNVDVSLQRCVGRLTVVVLNNIHDCQLAIGGIGLSAVNPSTGYYFPQSEPDESVPSYTNLAFHDLASTVVLPPSKNKIIFDRYVYETKDIPEGLSFRLFGAVFKAGVDVTLPSSFNSYTFDNGSSPKNGKQYLLRSAASASSNYYIGVLNDGGLGCDEFLDDVELIRNPKIKNFLWKVGTSNPRTLNNVGTGKYIKLNYSTGNQVDLGLGDSGTSGTSGTSFNFTGSATSGYLITDYGYGYGLACDPESARGLVAIDSPNTKTNTRWILREATLDNNNTYPVYKDCEIPYRQHAINYIDDYGVSKLLTRIKRNEHVTVSINVSYDREYMQFDFKVKAWETKDNTTTFD